MRTDRLELRLPAEADRNRFVELFADEAFMAFSGGTLDEAAGNERFDAMVRRTLEFDYAKQCVIERSTGTILGYSGIDKLTWEGAEHLEYGYRLIPSARGKGYATEAGLAILAHADAQYRDSGTPGEVYAVIDPTNLPSQNVAGKLGFVFEKQAIVQGFLDNLYTRQLG